MLARTVSGVHGGQAIIHRAGSGFQRSFVQPTASIVSFYSGFPGTSTSEFSYHVVSRRSVLLGWNGPGVPSLMTGLALPALKPTSSARANTS